jgi:hypothetical protein
MLAVLVLVVLAAAVPQPAAPSIDSKELAEYRLTRPVFQRFQRATRLILTATRADPRFATAPLFTKEIAVSGDAPAMAAALQQRLEREPALAGALFAADLDAREYTKFALALFAARLAHGFIKSGVLRRVPPGPPSDNVAFIETHRPEILALLKEMGVE